MMTNRSRPEPGRRENRGPSLGVSRLTRVLAGAAIGTVLLCAGTALAHQIKYRVCTYMLSGPVVGTPWAWRIECQNTPSTFSPLLAECPGVPGGSPLQVAQQFSASILQESLENHDGVFVIAGAAEKAGMTLMTVFATDDSQFALYVGPEGGPADQLVDLNPVDFSATIVRLPLSGTDCNDNGWDDALDALTGDLRDVNGNGIADECDLLHCPGDLTLDGVVDQSDMGQLLGDFGCQGEVLWECSGDVNLDLVVDQTDLGLLLPQLGMTCGQ